MRTLDDPAVRVSGLAAFSSTIEIDPWTQFQLAGGILSAQLVGGTETYFSPEQAWLKSELARVKQDDDEAYLELKRQWVLTPSTSDSFQAAKTVLEMHARPNKAMKSKWQHAPLECLRACVSRTPAEVLESMSPPEAEAWVVDKLKLGQFKGRLVDNAVDGSKLLGFPTMTLKEQNLLIKVTCLFWDNFSVLLLIKNASTPLRPKGQRMPRR